MAAASMGTFGDFKYRKSNGASAAELVWISKPFDPLDERESAPVSRHKIIDTPQPLSELSSEWRPARQQSLRDITRRGEEQHTYPSLRTTRCEDWSTLREMLPSRGRPKRIEHPRWGVGLGDAPQMVLDPPPRNPIITSAMSRYVDEMHLTHRQFKLF